MRAVEVELVDYAQWRMLPELRFSPILEGALDAFHAHGFHGATIRDLARSLDITVPAIYYHHPSKESMLFALLDTSITRLVRMCEAAQSEGSTGSERFDNLVECLVRYTARSGKVSYLDSEMRSLSTENRQTYVSKRAAVERMLRAAVEAGVEEGGLDVPDPRSATRAILGMIQAIATWYRPGGSIDIDRLVQDYLTHARRIVGATTI